jgi:phosphoribosylamine--glycine ligase
VLPPFPFDDEKTYDENSRNAAIVFRTADRDGIQIEDAKRVADEAAAGDACRRSESAAGVDGSGVSPARAGCPSS